jgi:hypothetical protein
VTPNQILVVRPTYTSKKRRPLVALQMKSPAAAQKMRKSPLVVPKRRNPTVARSSPPRPNHRRLAARPIIPIPKITKRQRRLAAPEKRNPAVVRSNPSERNGPLVVSKRRNPAVAPSNPRRRKIIVERVFVAHPRTPLSPMHILAVPAI